MDRKRILKVPSVSHCERSGLSPAKLTNLDIELKVSSRLLRRFRATRNDELNV